MTTTETKTETTRAAYGSLTPSMEELNNGHKSMISRLERELRDSVGENYRKRCAGPCGQVRLIKFFGVRTMRQAGTGKILKVRWQSYCTDCRSIKKPKAEVEVSATTVREQDSAARAKEAVKAKVRAARQKPVKASPEVESVPEARAAEEVVTVAPEALEEVVVVPALTVEPVQTMMNIGGLKMAPNEYLTPCGEILAKGERCFCAVCTSAYEGR
jgi:hypothetical protein